MASVVDSAAWTDIENFQLGRIFPEDYPEIADAKASMSGTHSDYHVGERIRVLGVVFDLADNPAGNIAP
jgi:hypothetical protein